ncbi:PqqD family protein [Acidocella sp.]|uniref:PqqD family protein n=1 Tax=Acidocella sp. TaxID=50710 RepID=UPI0017A4F315|nr:PqqD family protein [Acidocella sp.]NNM56864.1 PqqD family protein [Acidocella sp.]
MDAHLIAKASGPVVTADGGPDFHQGAPTAAGLRFYGDEFVFDIRSGMFFRLSATASFILRALAGGAAIADLPAAMERQYGIDHASALRDIQLFLNELAALEPLDRVAHDQANDHANAD